MTDDRYPLSLLAKVRRYNRGEGEYNFSRLPNEDRGNAAFDAWNDISAEIDALLARTSTPAS